MKGVTLVMSLFVVFGLARADRIDKDEDSSPKVHHASHSHLKVHKLNKHVLEAETESIPSVSRKSDSDSAGTISETSSSSSEKAADPSNVPEPGTLLLVGTALALFASILRVRSKSPISPYLSPDGGLSCGSE